MLCFLLCHVRGPDQASPEDHSGSQDSLTSKGSRTMWGGRLNDQGMPLGNRLEGGVLGQGGKRGLLETDSPFSSLGNWAANSWAMRHARRPGTSWDEGCWQSCFLPGVMTHPSSTLATAVLFTAPPGGQGTVSRPPSLLLHPLAQGMARRLAGRSPDLHYD